MKELHYFASANTSEGFKNHFDCINPNENGFTYILKGGSGTGKSTFMKSIGEHFAKKGYDIEYFHCSSDMSSLDGVRIVEKNIAIVDGTAPHVTEAKLPQVTDKILNVGEYIDDNLSKYREKLEGILAIKKSHFDKAYSYLSATKALIIMEQTQANIDKSLIEEKANGIIKKLGLKHLKKKKEARSLFTSCIDTGGIKHLENHYKNEILLNEKSLPIGYLLMAKLAEMLDSLNIGYVKILNPLLDNLIDGIYIESIDTVILNNKTNENKYKNDSLISTLIKKAGNCINRARQQHKKLEKYYINAMNFGKLNLLKEKVIGEIEKR